MLIRVLRAVLFLFLVRVWNLTTGKRESTKFYSSPLKTFYVMQGQLFLALFQC